MSQIRIKDGPQRGKIIALDANQPLVIGREPSCGIQIVDQGVSREHARIFLVGEMVFLRDLGSRNGSFVNDERVEEELLREGDKIRVGTTELVFESRRVAQEHGGNLQYEDDEEFKTSLELKVDDLYVMDGASAGQEGGYFKAICQATQIVQGERDEKKLFERLLEVIVEHIPADYIYLFLKDELTGAVTPRASRQRSAGTNIPISRSILRRSIEDSCAILTADAMKDDRFKSGDSILMYKIRAVLCVPIQGHAQATGAIYAVNTRAGETFEETDLQLLTAIGAQLAFSIENLTAIRGRRRMFLRTIGRLISLLEGCSQGHRGHSERVSIFSSAIAKELGQTDSQIPYITMAGLLHDVGKVPSVWGLSAAATEHSSGVAPVLASIEFLKDLPGLPEVLPSIRSHHERFDGSGIPEQLKGDAIPLGARILGAANVFDKLVFPNGNPSPDVDPDPALVRAAFTDMIAQSGRLFDPQIIQALVVAYRHGRLRALSRDPASDSGEIIKIAQEEFAFAEREIIAAAQANIAQDSNTHPPESKPPILSGETARTSIPIPRSSSTQPLRPEQEKP